MKRLLACHLTLWMFVYSMNYWLAWSNLDYTLNVKADMNCRSKDVVYVTRCSGCGENYIGETGMELKDRVTVHKQQIRDPNVRCLGVSKHIDDCGNGKFTIFPFYKLYTSNKQLRLEKEQMFIKLMKPKLNSRMY